MYSLSLSLSPFFLARKYTANLVEAVWHISLTSADEY